MGDLRAVENPDLFAATDVGEVCAILAGSHFWTL